MTRTKLGRATYHRIICVVLGVGLSVLACSSGESDSDSTDEVAGDTGDAGRSGGTARAGSGNGGAVGEAGAIGEAGAASGGRVAGGGGTVSRSGAGGTSTTAGTGGMTLGDTACSNGEDDDDDGLVDGLDPECTGPFDNVEDSFETGIPGDNRDPKWQDCFFDGNSGAGDDNCRYRTECLYGDLPATDPDCTLTDACVKFCAPLTQNGCDCFGCCTVQDEDGKSVDILEVASCSIASLDDEEACPRCTKNTQCANECGECELCPGKTAADLPSSCGTPPTTGGAGGGSSTGGSPGTGGTSGAGGAPEPPPPTYTCDNGEQVCGPGLAPCTASEYCSLGCCIPFVR